MFVFHKETKSKLLIELYKTRNIWNEQWKTEGKINYDEREK